MPRFKKGDIVACHVTGRYHYTDYGVACIVHGYNHSGWLLVSVAARGTAAVVYDVDEDFFSLVRGDTMVVVSSLDYLESKELDDEDKRIINAVIGNAV